MNIFEVDLHDFFMSESGDSDREAHMDKKFEEFKQDAMKVLCAGGAYSFVHAEKVYQEASFNNAKDFLDFECDEDFSKVITNILLGSINPREELLDLLAVAIAELELQGYEDSLNDF